MKTVFIYALKDPDTGQIRYVGKSANPEKRLRVHLCDTRNNHRTSWINNLKLANLTPVLVIIDEVPESEWPQLECAYLQYFRECGFDLANHTDGGDAGPSRAGTVHSELSCQKMSESRIGRKKSAETRANMCVAQKLRRKETKVSDETRERMGRARMGMKLSDEHKANIGKAGMGRIATPKSILRRRITFSFKKLLRICQPIE